MKIEDLFLVKIAYEEGSFLRIKDKLGKSEDKIKEELIKIESDIGVKLFKVVKNRVVFIEAGVIFAENCCRALAGFDTMSSDFIKSKDIDSLSMGVENKISLIYITRASQIAMDKHGISFNILHLSREDIVKGVYERKYEVGVIILDDDLRGTLDKYSLEFKRVSSRRPVVIVDKNHPLSKNKVISLEDLKKYNRVSFQNPLEDRFSDRYSLKEKYGINLGKILVENLGDAFQILKNSSFYFLGGINEDEGDRLEGFKVIPIKEITDRQEVGYIIRKGEPIRAIFKEIADLLEKFKTVKC